MGPFLKGYGVMGTLNFRKRPPVNRASKFARRVLEPAEPETVNGKLQLATRALHNQAAVLSCGRS
jgi:hypothetical protein